MDLQICFTQIDWFSNLQKTCVCLCVLANCNDTTITVYGLAGIRMEKYAMGKHYENIMSNIKV